MTGTADGVRAFRVRFAGQAGPGDAVLAQIREPVVCAAVSTPADAAEALAAGSRDDGSLLCVVAGATGAGGAGFEKEIDAVFAAKALEEPVFRGSVRSVRVTWSRALVFLACPPDIEAESLDAVLRFTSAARATFDLERDMAASWAVLDRFAQFSHSVGKADQAFQPDVDAMTERLVRMKIAHLRTQNAIEQLDPLLNGNSKRLFAQLASPAALADRMEMLEDPIQFAQDHCELANTRLIEGKYSHTELKLEVWIVIILVAELLAILVDKVPHAWLPAGW